jgi:hypothetical protein
LPNTADNGGKGRANSWKTYSDIRYKTNIRPISNALDKINQLEGVYFNWKSNNIQEIGLIAQQVEPIIPEVVTTTRVIRVLIMENLLLYLFKVLKNSKFKSNPNNSKLMN